MPMKYHTRRERPVVGAAEGPPSDADRHIDALGEGRLVARYYAQETALHVWMCKIGITETDFCGKLGVARLTLRNWRFGITLPGVVKAFQIEALTLGEVPASYWCATKLGLDEQRHVSPSATVIKASKRATSKQAARAVADALKYVENAKKLYTEAAPDGDEVSTGPHPAEQGE